MASYHDLKKQTYEEIHARPFTRIHGRPTWRLKEKLVDKCKEVALNYYAVGYDWSGGYGLLAEIIGAARYAADNPLLPAYIPPSLPPTQTPTPPTMLKYARRPTRQPRKKGLSRTAGVQEGSGGEYQGRPQPRILLGPQARPMHDLLGAKPLPVGCTGHQGAQGPLHKAVGPQQQGGRNQGLA